MIPQTLEAESTSSNYVKSETESVAESESEIESSVSSSVSRNPQDEGGKGTEINSAYPIEIKDANRISLPWR